MAIAAGGPVLRIITVNDIYELENLPRLRSLVVHWSSASPAAVTLVILAGDFVAPSLLSSLDGGRGMVDCLNAVGVTHAVLGNHEDDIPTDELRARVRELDAICLGTNVHGFEPSLPTSDIVEVGRVRVGLVGVVMDDRTAYRRPPFGGARMEPANLAALREASRLFREAGCSCVIPITHQAIADDRALAEAQREPPFAAIVGGHEHEVFVEDVSGTWILKAGVDAVRACVVDLVWPADAPPFGARDLPTVTVRVEDVARYPEDPALRERVERHMKRVSDLETSTLVKFAPGLELSSIGARARQTSMGAFLCSRVRDALGAEGCLINGGGIRGSRTHRGQFTYGALKTEVPFDNEIVIVKLPGRVLSDAVRASRARAPAEFGGFLQVDDGMAVDATGGVTAVGGAAIDEGRDYAIAIVRNLFGGLDGIEPLTRFAETHAGAIPPVGSGRETKLVLVESFAAALWRDLGSFDGIDADGDGTVTKSEVHGALAREAGEASTVTAGLVVQVLDANHDGGISRDEAAEALTKR